MKIGNAEIECQLRLGEDSAWEFKQIEFAGNRPKGPSRDHLADEIAAFANAEGGVLLCGVTGDGDVQDLSREQMDALDRLLVELCSDSIRPPLYPFISRQELDSGKRLLLLRWIRIVDITGRSSLVEYRSAPSAKDEVASRP